MLALALPSESLFVVVVVVANADSAGFLLGRFFVEVLLMGCKTGVVRTGLSAERAGYFLRIERD